MTRPIISFQLDLKSSQSTPSTSSRLCILKTFSYTASRKVSDILLRQLYSSTTNGFGILKHLFSKTITSTRSYHFQECPAMTRTIEDKDNKQILFSSSLSITLHSHFLPFILNGLATVSVTTTLGSLV